MRVCSKRQCQNKRNALVYVPQCEGGQGPRMSTELLGRAWVSVRGGDATGPESPVYPNFRLYATPFPLINVNAQIMIIQRCTKRWTDVFC